MFYMLKSKIKKDFSWKPRFNHDHDEYEVHAFRRQKDLEKHLDNFCCQPLASYPQVKDAKRNGEIIIHD